MLKRTITSLLLLVIGFPAVVFGGVPYLVLIGFFLGAAAWEYVDIFRVLDLRPARLLVVGAVLAIAISRSFSPASSTPTTAGW